MKLSHDGARRFGFRLLMSEGRVESRACLLQCLPLRRVEQILMPSTRAPFVWHSFDAFFEPSADARAPFPGQLVPLQSFPRRSTPHGGWGKGNAGGGPRLSGVFCAKSVTELVSTALDSEIVVTHDEEVPPSVLPVPRRRWCAQVVQDGHGSPSRVAPPGWRQLRSRALSVACN